MFSVREVNYFRNIKFFSVSTHRDLILIENNVFLW